MVVVVENVTGVFKNSVIGEQNGCLMERSPTAEPSDGGLRAKPLRAEKNKHIRKKITDN